MAPHHRPFHPELFHQRFHMDRFLMGVISFQFRVLCLGLTIATYVFHDCWLQCSPGVCGAGTTSHCRKSSLLLSHDMTSLDMQIQSIRFVANRQRRV